MLGRLRQGVRRRSSISTRPRSFARRSVARTVDRETPAIAATASWQRRRSPRFVASAATTARTACSARVKRAASWGGSRPDEAQRRRQYATGLRRYVQTHADYVGPAFAEEARKIHYGETPDRPIYGETSLEEARALLDEGLDVAPLPDDPTQGH